MCFKKKTVNKAFNNLKTIYDYLANGYEPAKMRPDVVKVCFIDDEGYDIETFRKTGYSQSDRITRFDSLNQVAAYNVIICDIDGVGVDLDSKRQGLGVAKLIKDNFPEKLVFLFSGKNPYDYGEDYTEMCDGFFSKAKSTGEIASLLNTKAAVFWDPIAAWFWCESYLRKQKIPNKTIALLENRYVESMQKKTNLLVTDNGTDWATVIGVTANVISTVAQIVSLILSI